MIQKQRFEKINYYENNIKLNNKDNSKNNDNEIKEIIQPKYIIFIFIKVKEYFAACVYLSNPIIKFQEQGEQYVQK